MISTDRRSRLGVAVMVHLTSDLVLISTLEICALPRAYTARSLVQLVRYFRFGVCTHSFVRRELVIHTEGLACGEGVRFSLTGMCPCQMKSVSAPVSASSACEGEKGDHNCVAGEVEALRVEVRVRGSFLQGGT